MPTVHMTFTDTPTGGVDVQTDFHPSIGQRCTPAQGVALEIFNRTSKQWGIEAVHVRMHAEASSALQPPAGA
jgi:hypothetical protein